MELSLQELKLHEQKLLGEASQKKLLPRDIQMGYLNAAQRFVDSGQIENARYLFERALRRAPPGLLLLHSYLDFLGVRGERQAFNQLFNREFRRLKKSELRNDPSLSGEVLLHFLRINHQLSSELSNLEFKRILALPQFENWASLLDSVTQAKRGNYEEALRLSDSSPHPHDSEFRLFRHYLKRMSGLPSVECTEGVKGSLRPRFKISCQVLENPQAPGAKKSLRESGEVSQWGFLNAALESS